MSKKVHLLDYVAGNIRSLVNAIEALDYEVEWIKKPEDIANAEKLILPGVGHFGHCLSSLSEAGYLPAIQAHIASGKPFFGICVGLQALFTASDEAPGVSGLGLIEGQLKRFTETRVERSSDEAASSKGKKSVPCIGWNSAQLVPDDKAPNESDKVKSFYGLDDLSKYYYVHSYFAPYEPGCAMEAQGWTIATAKYGDEIYAGAIGKGNIFATQFHPEKSGNPGLRVIRAFLEGRQWEEVSTSPNPGSENMSTNHGLTRRIIACLDVRTNDDGDLVVTKGDQYDVREKGGSSSDTNPTTGKPVSGQVRNLGKPVHLAEKYYQQSADEITFLNITSFRSTPLLDQPMLEILRQTSRTVFVPLTIGGGIRDTVDPASGRKVPALEVAKLYFESGADKVSIGSDAVTAAEAYWARGGVLSGDTAIETISQAYGRQAVVVSVDPKRIILDQDYYPTPNTQPNTAPPSALDIIQSHTTSPPTKVWYQCTISGGRSLRPLSVRALVTAVVAMGAGEILLNAIDRDGTNAGFDLELIAHVKNCVDVPVIASSGAGGGEHFVQVFGVRPGGGRVENGEGGGDGGKVVYGANGIVADAALGAGIFHRGEWTVGAVKDVVERSGIAMRRE